MRWHVKRNHALHDKIIALTIQVLDVPRVKKEDKLIITEQYPGFWQGVAYYGFMEKPNIPELLKQTPPIQACNDHEAVTYYIGHESIVAKDGTDALPRWQSYLFGLDDEKTACMSPSIISCRAIRSSKSAAE